MTLDPQGGSRIFPGAFEGGRSDDNGGLPLADGRLLIASEPSEPTGVGTGEAVSSLALEPARNNKGGNKDENKLKVENLFTLITKPYTLKPKP